MAKTKEEKASDEAKENGEVIALAVLLIDNAGYSSHVRTYSLAEHGENFIELAKMFKSKLENQGKKVSLREVK